MKPFIFSTPATSRLPCSRERDSWATATCCLPLGSSLGFNCCLPTQDRCSSCSARSPWRPREWGRISLVGATVFVLVELEKAVLVWRVKRQGLERLASREI